MPKPYSLDLRERVVRFVDEGHSRHAAAAHFRVSVSFVVNLVKAFRVRGSLAPKPNGGRRHAKLEPHRAFLLEKVAEKADITMPELAAELAAATCEKADPASLSRWLIGIGYRFKKTLRASEQDRPDIKQAREECRVTPTPVPQTWKQGLVQSSPLNRSKGRIVIKTSCASCAGRLAGEAKP